MVVNGNFFTIHYVIVVVVVVVKALYKNVLGNFVLLCESSVFTNCVGGVVVYEKVLCEHEGSIGSVSRGFNLSALNVVERVCKLGLCSVNRNCGCVCCCYLKYRNVCYELNVVNESSGVGKGCNNLACSKAKYLVSGKGSVYRYEKHELSVRACHCVSGKLGKCFVGRVDVICNVILGVEYLGQRSSAKTTGSKRGYKRENERKQRN